ncbi:phosphate acyltransferase [Calditerrivibrio nitroreducens]|uniref:phosphate acyltransferase n=1 Tax=Calditerrivibrio TaxID=545865 RepID=UPI003C78C7A3
MIEIGSNIKKIIDTEQIDVEFLLKQVNLSEEEFKAILENETKPTVSTLLKLSRALNKDLSLLIYGNEFKPKKAVATRRDERVPVRRRRGYDYESLAPFYIGRSMEPLIVDVRRDEKQEFSAHKGEEFHYVMSGKVKTVVGEEEFILEDGDTLYFDSSIPHCINSITDYSRLLVVVFNSESMVHQVKGKKMRDMVQAAKLLPKKNISLVCPDDSSLGAGNRAIEEGIVDKIYLVGNIAKTEAYCKGFLNYKNHYEFVDLDVTDNYELDAARKGVEIIRRGDGHLIMKGKINTQNFVKAILDKEKGLNIGRRLSLVSIFELPSVDRLIFLTDPAINPSLFINDKLESSFDILKNAIEAAKSLGVDKPRVALLDANEVPSSKIPTSLLEKQLSEINWEDAYVYGPLSYDLALYPDSVEKKGLKDNPVAGKADILVVPHIEGGNFLYKAWVMTMGVEVANLVLGAACPVILTSRSDGEMTKFLTICASSIFSSHSGKL